MNDLPAIRGGIVVLDPKSGAVMRTINLQFNPEQLTRKLQPNAGSADSGDRADVMRMRGPANETITLNAEIDVDDQSRFFLNQPFDSGIEPELSALESLVQPSVQQLTMVNNQLKQGILEITPMEAPLTVFVWNKTRVLPVKITEFSITEEGFDKLLNPIRAKVSLGFYVLSVSDVGFSHRAGSLFMAYLQRRESLAMQSTLGSSTDLVSRGNL